MSRILMLAVVGGGEEPYRRLVEVDDPVRYMGILRAKLLKEMIDRLNVSPTPIDIDDKQADALRTLKVKLYETGLTEYPDTEDEVSEIYRRFDAGQRLNAKL